MTEKKLYEFREDGASCVIYDPKPPRHWYNYLWSEKGYCAQISENGHGRSYYLNERADMCMINNQDARYVYLRDDEEKRPDGTSVCWNIGAMPMNETVREYSCTHSIGYSLLQGENHGIASDWRIYVPQDGFHEVWTLTLRNRSEKVRHLSMFEAVSFELEGFSYPRYYENYRCMETSFHEDLNGIYCSSGHPFAPHRRYNAYLVSSEPVYAFDGELSRFCGSASTIMKTDASSYALFPRPDVVVSGSDCTNSEGALFILGGVLQHKITLRPGETRKVQVAFGVSESLEEAKETARQIRNPEYVEDEFQRTAEYNLGKYASLSVRTPDEKINHIMSHWVKKQVDCCIVGKKA